MDDLRAVIHTLSAESKKEFSSFIRRQKKKNQRKDLELFELLQQKKSYKPQQIIDCLYPAEANAVAYYALRKRLMQHLTDFIVLKRMEEDPSAGSSIMGLLSLARYLFDARADRVAWNMLRKAEKSALEHEQFDLLHAVYNLQIEKASNEFADELKVIIQKWNANKALADEEERANIANSLITQQLALARLEGRNLQFDSIIQKVLQQYGLAEAISKRPALFYKLISIARSAVLARKDFFTFEPYIIQQYHQIAANPGFLPAHQYYKLNILYMIAHVLYRNRKFYLSNTYLQEFYEATQQEAKIYYSAFYPKYVFLKTANAAFLRNLPQAVLLTEDLIQNKANLLSQRDKLTAYLGLSFLYFAQKAYVKANWVLLRITYSDKRCETIMGKEWVLKKNLGELIIQYELGNLDFALQKIQAVARSFKALLQQPVYQNVAGFLYLLEQLVVQPHAVSQKKFNQQVESSLAFMPVEKEDLHAISYYAWLKSKMVNRAYYDILPELAHTR